MSDARIVKIRVTVRNQETGKIIHNKVGDHEDPDFRKWLGRTSFWAFREGHTIFSAPYRDEKEPGSHSNVGQYIVHSAGDYDHEVKQIGTHLVVATCANKGTAAKAVAALNACAVIPLLDNLKG